MTSMHDADNKTYRKESQTGDKEADHVKYPTSIPTACRSTILGQPACQYCQLPRGSRSGIRVLLIGG